MYEFRSPNIVGNDFVTVRWYEKNPPQGFAGGGLVQAAEAIRKTGRGGDEILLHVNPDEFRQMQEAWGEPSYNPHSGLPEYGLFSKIKKVAKGLVKHVKQDVGNDLSHLGRDAKSVVKSPIFQAVAPILLNFFVPGLGVAVGSALGASGAAAGIVGRAAIGAALGAAGGGGRGALAGAIGGGAAGGGGKLLGSALGASGASAGILGNAIAGGAASKVRGGSFTKGALTGGALSAAAPYLNNALVDTKLGDALSLNQQETLTSGLGGGAPQVASVGPSGGEEVGPPAPTGAEGSTSSGGALAQAGSEVGGTGLPTTSVPEIMSPMLTDEALQALIPAPQAPQIENPLVAGLKNAVQLKNLPKTAAGIGALGQLAGIAGPQQQMVSGQGQAMTPQGPTTTIDPAQFNRTQNNGAVDYYNYGTGLGGEYDFFKDDAFGDEEDDDNGDTEFAEGGEVEDEGIDAEMESEDPRYVKGEGTGRSDEIDAKLSDGEYVFDAETVALLGDGSSDAGASILDKLRRQIRSWKGKKLAKGEISDDAPDPAELLGLGEDEVDDEMDDEGEEMEEIEEDIPDEEMLEEEPTLAEGGKISKVAELIKHGKVPLKRMEGVANARKAAADDTRKMKQDDLEGYEQNRRDLHRQRKYGTSYGPFKEKDRRFQRGGKAKR